MMVREKPQRKLEHYSINLTKLAAYEWLIFGALHTFIYLMRECSEWFRPCSAYIIPYELKWFERN